MLTVGIPEGEPIEQVKEQELPSEVTLKYPVAVSLATMTGGAGVSGELNSDRHAAVTLMSLINGFP